ncbi:hypothetical protein QC761_0041100 [Podospora bellae-mahoneyi]|uniref:Uncharacterized protein n=1 Tax=Podospora bellae-mahoneyi TaxID=2093777 RepID=A0ABR0FS37_9PEZI|nr:hypothetical protein QC761_0041100 [Podospora bellae-mahoneyi]
MNDSAIGDSLQIGQPTCSITKGCILEGELAVYSGKEHRILNFQEIRKHIFRSGIFIGTAQDSQAHSWEHLMIVHYDVRMFDDTSLLSVKIQRDEGIDRDRDRDVLSEDAHDDNTLRNRTR